jgi:putative hydrolase of the HAD superfamily
MQQLEKKYIFDLDGTLYSFAPGYVSFGKSAFYAELRGRIIGYVAMTLNVANDEAKRIFEEIDSEFNGELSIGFEKVYGIDRYEYYEATWSLSPKDYIGDDSRLVEALSSFRGHALLLTAAPRAWALGALKHLGVTDIFGDNIITGEPDMRKPDPAVFRQAAALLNTHPSNIISIGDQNYSDIVPAKSIGMTTILIGPEQLDAHYRADSIYDAISLIKERL